ncbi:hypothetical protein J6590_101167 [Homalodisca vitripennis]|nr:hypothetical protein J6590_101167 [Homalodisca vitripennis]
MEAERVFLACTDYAPVPAGLFESLSTQVRRLTKIESTVDYCLAFTAIKSGLDQIPSAKNRMCHLNPGNLIDVQEWHITIRKCRDSGAQGLFDRSSLLLQMTVGSWWGLFPTNQRFYPASLKYLRLEAAPTPNLTYPKYPATPEAAERDTALQRFYPTLVVSTLCRIARFPGRNCSPKFQNRRSKHSQEVLH